MSRIRTEYEAKTEPDNSQVKLVTSIENIMQPLVGNTFTWVDYEAIKNAIIAEVGRIIPAKINTVNDPKFAELCQLPTVIDIYNQCIDDIRGKL